MGFPSETRLAVTPRPAPRGNGSQRSTTTACARQSNSRGVMKPASSACPRLQRTPRSSQRQCGERAGGKPPRGELAGVCDERHGQVVDRRVVSDQHHRVDPVRHATQTSKQLARRHAVELALDLNFAGHVDQVKRLAGPPRRGAKRQRGLDLLAAQVCPDELRRFAPTRRERPIVTGELRIVPARLCVTQQQQTLDLSHHRAILADVATLAENPFRRRCRRSVAPVNAGGR
jgi:hypothetical protein